MDWTTMSNYPKMEHFVLNNCEYRPCFHSSTKLCSNVFFFLMEWFHDSREKMTVTKKKGQGQWSWMHCQRTRSDLEMTSWVLWSWILPFTSRNVNSHHNFWIIAHLYPRTATPLALKWLNTQWTTSPTKKFKSGETGCLISVKQVKKYVLHII